MKIYYRNKMWTSTPLSIAFIVFNFGFLASATAQTSKKFSDETAFRRSLKIFKKVVGHDNLMEATKLIHFPFFTSKADSGNGKDLPIDGISKVEFETYKRDIFNKDIIRILPKLGEESLSEIEGNEDTYYTALRKKTDAKSKMYELYAQYNQDGRKTDDYFGFIFGRIAGHYKLIAYYSKWPIR